MVYTVTPGRHRRQCSTCFALAPLAVAVVSLTSYSFRGLSFELSFSNTVGQRVYDAASATAVSAGIQELTDLSVF